MAFHARVFEGLEADVQTQADDVAELVLWATLSDAEVDQAESSMLARAFADVPGLSRLDEKLVTELIERMLAAHDDEAKMNRRIVELADKIGPRLRRPVFQLAAWCALHDGELTPWEKGFLELLSKRFDISAVEADNLIKASL